VQMTCVKGSKRAACSLQNLETKKEGRNGQTELYVRVIGDLEKCVCELARIAAIPRLEFQASHPICYVFTH